MFSLRSNKLHKALYKSNSLVQMWRMLLGVLDQVALSCSTKFNGLPNALVTDKHGKQDLKENTLVE